MLAGDAPVNPGVLVDHGRMLDVLGREGQLLTAATHDVDPDAVVAGVSLRTARETVRLAGDSCEEALRWLDVPTPRSRRVDVPPHATLPEVTRRFTARLADLLAEFDTRPASDPCRTWWYEHEDVGFWLRRMVHATTVFRVDVQTAAQVEVTPLDPEVALDGIDEMLHLWFGHRLNVLGISATRACSVQIRAADRVWHVRTTYEHAQVTRGGAQHECAEIPAPREETVVSGNPGALFLWLWGRIPERLVHVTGDHDAVAQLWGLLRLATQ